MIQAESEIAHRAQMCKHVLQKVGPAERRAAQQQPFDFFFLEAPSAFFDFLDDFFSDFFSEFFPGLAAAASAREAAAGAAASEAAAGAAAGGIEATGGGFCTCPAPPCMAAISSGVKAPPCASLAKISGEMLQAVGWNGVPYMGGATCIDVP